MAGLLALVCIALHQATQSGGHGVLPGPNSQPYGHNEFGLKGAARQRLTVRRFVLIIAGCLASVGIGFSTISAQSNRASLTGYPIKNPQHCVAARRRRRSNKGVAASEPSPRRALQAAADVDKHLARLRRSKGNRAVLPVEDAPAVCASYARYSSDLQNEFSNEDQLRRCRQKAQSMGWDIDPQLEFQDAAISGSVRDRAGLEGLRAAAAARQFNTLFVFTINRLGRDTGIVIPLLQELTEDFGVRVISVVEGLDSTQPGWELPMLVTSYMGAQALRELAAHVRRGHEGRILNGFSVGDYCFGYRSEPVHATSDGAMVGGGNQPGNPPGVKSRQVHVPMRYVIDEAASVWVQRIFQWYVQEKRSIRWIAKELTRQGAPKDHRASTKGWHHAQVRTVLENPKYIGVWAWGVMQNVRIKKKKMQVPREVDEIRTWTRNLPELRIISDQQFEAARMRLKQNRDKWEATRTKNGKLRGSSPGGSHAQPRYLLSGLLQCAECGARLVTGGAGGKYLCCPGHTKGLCSAKTQVNRRLAERLIVEAISSRLQNNPAWEAAVLDEARQAWQAIEDSVPSQLEAVRKQLEQVRRGEINIGGQIEKFGPSATCQQRLSELEFERHELSARERELCDSDARRIPEPTIGWVREMLQTVEAVVTTATPAATTALMELVGGAIVVREVQREGKKRCYMQASFAMESTALLKASAAGEPLAKYVGQVDPHSDVVVLDLREPSPTERLADEVKLLWDEGVPYHVIGQRIGLHPTGVTKALQHWHVERGLAPPKLSAQPRRQKSLHLAEQLADPVKELLDRGLSHKETGSRLQCSLSTITAAVKHWHEQRGLPVPDGRTRRRELRIAAKQYTSNQDGSGESAITDTLPRAS